MRRTILLVLSAMIIGIAYTFWAAPAVTPPATHPGSPPSRASAESLADALRPPATKPCPESSNLAEVRPLGSGPAVLAEIKCLQLPSFDSYQSAPILSPDGQSLAFWDKDRTSLLDVVSLENGSGFRLFNRVAFRDLGSSFQSDGSDALAWNTNGSGLWSVEQEVLSSGWAKSGLTPIVISTTGEIRRLTPPRHSDGQLDALAWVGGDGLAIAEFGTRGEQYQPEHSDPAPTLAMVNVPTGKVLDEISPRDAEILRLRTRSYPGLKYFRVASVELEDGRLTTLLQFDRVVDRSQQNVQRGTPEKPKFLPAVWLLWTQGQTPKTISIPIEDPAARAVLTPSGTQILAYTALQPDGVVHIEFGTPPPPIPVHGTVAALVDITSGRTLWSLDATASESWRAFSIPVIDPAGRFALVAMPATNRRQMIALVSMSNGRILQRFSAACNGCYGQHFGFVQGGDKMWIWVRNKIIFYDLN